MYHDQPNSKEVLYALFILHASGKRTRTWTCPNCGTCLHLVEREGRELILTCLNCTCRSRSVDHHEP